MTPRRLPALTPEAQLQKILLRMEQIAPALFRIASLDFSEPIVPEQDGSVADGMVAGINMLADEE